MTKAPPLFEEFEYLTLPISDSDTTDITSVLDATFNFIDAAIHGGESAALVHCQMGQSRGAAIVTAYLMRKNNLSFEDAFAHVKEKRSIVNCHNFQRQLRALETELNAIRPSQISGSTGPTAEIETGATVPTAHSVQAFVHPAVASSEEKAATTTTTS